MSQNRSRTASNSPQPQATRQNLRSQVSTESPKKKAEAFLVKHGYLDSDSYARSVLYNVLGTIANTEKKEFTNHHAIYSEAIKSAVVLLKVTDEEEAEQGLQNAMNDMLTKIDRNSQIEEKLTSLQEEVSNKIDRLSQQLTGIQQLPNANQPLSKYKNTNNLLTEMNIPTAAKWLRDISNSIQFETTLNSAIDLIQREFGLAINFVPTWFNPENDEDLREMEYVNELPSHSIGKARWANGTKDGKKKPGQRTATLLVKINDPDVANAMIAKEIRIKDDHASRDRICPKFKQAWDNMNKRSPTNLLPFFPTETDWTWLEDPSNAPRALPAPRIVERPSKYPRQTTLTNYMNYGNTNEMQTNSLNIGPDSTQTRSHSPSPSTYDA
ncbi:hypothetical protein K435DRAFT_795923 [Dendrothele bispora CBS 962.96]|uniref:Uncharacterized protein n=1 Tax=Dendrothele bispora (strain CBS 962.96) TaxID=1314807 RepID=A0A4S8M797_DENBC|nr:hypothetical protein K435DRAFT_795923 [Dendrothele bispora CBS 962.96]